MMIVGFALPPSIPWSMRGRRGGRGGGFNFFFSWFSWFSFFWLVWFGWLAMIDDFFWYIHGVLCIILEYIHVQSNAVCYATGIGLVD